jgi:O-antigen ligase
MKNLLRSHGTVNGAADLHRQARDQLPLKLLLLLIFSLCLMQPPVPLLGFMAVPTDFLFLAVVAAWALFLVRQRARLVWDRAYIFIALYLFAMAISIPGSESPRASIVKFLTQLYLASLPVIVASLVSTEAQLRTAVRWWLAGSALTAAVALASLAVFAANPDSPVVQFALSVKGTLPPGNYPRLQLTFMNANQACNYLTVSLMLLLAAWRANWVDVRAFAWLLAGILLASATTISPGLGGIVLGLGLSGWLLFRNAIARRLSLLAGVAGACLFIVAMAVTPILHPTAPYLIHVPVANATLAPSGRLMIWTDAVRNFMAHPLTGRGIGIDPVMVKYLDPSGLLETSTDAHNAFLSIAVQCGTIGLLALVLLVWHMASRTFPLRIDGDGPSVIRVGVGLGLLIGLVYEGLGGSFEDARHLWVAFGLLLASDRLSERTRAPRDRA